MENDFPKRVVVVVVAQQLFSSRPLTSAIQVWEVCYLRRVVPEILYCKLSWMSRAVEQVFYRVWCHSTLGTNIWYASSDAGHVRFQKSTMARAELSKCGTNRPR